MMTPAGLERAIPGSVGRCLIHWATAPDIKCMRNSHNNMACNVSLVYKASASGAGGRGHQHHQGEPPTATAAVPVLDRVGEKRRTLAQLSATSGRQTPETKVLGADVTRPGDLLIATAAAAVPVLATATTALLVLATAAAAGPALERFAETRALCAFVSNKKAPTLRLQLPQRGTPKALAVTDREAPNARQYQGAQPGCPIRNTPKHGRVYVGHQQQYLTLAGLEPAIFGSEDQRLIH